MSLSAQEMMERLGGTGQPVSYAKKKDKGKSKDVRIANEEAVEAIAIDPSLQDFLSTFPAAPEPPSAATTTVQPPKDDSALTQSITATLASLADYKTKDDTAIKDLEASRALPMLVSEIEKCKTQSSVVPHLKSSIPLLSQRLASHLTVLKSVSARTALLTGLIEDVHANAYQMGYAAAEAALMNSVGVRGMVRGLVREALAEERRIGRGLSTEDIEGEEGDDDGEGKAGTKRKRGAEGSRKMVKRKDTVLQNKLHYAVHLLILKLYRPTSTKGDVVPEGPNVVDDWPEPVAWGNGGKKELRGWDDRAGGEKVDVVWRPPFTEIRHQDTQDFIEAVTQVILSHLPTYSHATVREATTTYVQNIGKAIMQRSDAQKSAAQKVKSAGSRRVRRRETTRMAREEFIDSSPLAYVDGFHWIKSALTMIDAIPDYLSDDEEGRYVVERPGAEEGDLLGEEGGGEGNGAYFSEYEFYRERGLAGAVAIANGKKWEIRDQDWLNPYLIRCSMVLDEFILSKDTQGRFNRTPTWRGPAEKRTKNGEVVYPVVRPKIPETGEPNPLSTTGAIIFKSMVKEELRASDPLLERRLYDDPPKPSSDEEIGAMVMEMDDKMTLDEVMARPEWQELKQSVGKRLRKIPDYVDLEIARAEWAVSKAWPAHGLMP